LIHGSQGLIAAERISQALFSGDLSELSEGDMEQLALDGLPSITVGGDERSLLELLVDSGIAVTPRGEVTVGQARKFIQEGAIQVNGQKVLDVDAVLGTRNAIYKKFHLLKRGKKHFALIVWN
jgi:tyrosyl-tRNA synthetase